MNINDFIKKLRRNVNTHKYHYGHTLVIAGSQTMPGAGILCCLGAMRSGIGLVTHAVRQNCLNQIYMMCHPEVLLCIYKTVEDVLSYIKNKHISSLVIGPGLEVSKSNKEFIKTILFSSQLPVILDASGITCFNNDINILSKNINSKLILTPHLGEFARLLNININEIKHLTQKRDILNSLVKHTNITFVLKGYNTIVANKNNFYVNNTGTPAMATAGSGDVLSGIIATFISIRDIDIFEAIRFAVFVHGLAGEYTEYKHGPVGIMASDIANNVRFIIKQLMYNKKLVYRIHINIKKQYFL